jgi:hypothetical protein
VVYKTFGYLPTEMSLRYLLHRRAELRGLFTAQGRPDIDSLQHKFSEFKAAVDSVKKIPAAKE